jgi:hypothetical protein
MYIKGRGSPLEGQTRGPYQTYTFVPENRWSRDVISPRRLATAVVW